MLHKIFSYRSYFLKENLHSDFFNSSLTQGKYVSQNKKCANERAHYWRRKEKEAVAKEKGKRIAQANFAS